MSLLPESLKRRYTWRDATWTMETAALVASGVILFFWFLAIVAPSAGWGTWLVNPMPRPFGDAGFFMPLHFIIGVYWLRAMRDARKYRNPMLLTEDGHYAIDSKFSATKIGEHTLWHLGGLDQERPGRGTNDEGYAVIDASLVHAKQKDFDARGVTLIPCHRTEVPPGIYRLAIRSKDLPEEERWYRGFPSHQLLKDPKTGFSVADAIMARDAQANANYTVTEQYIHYNMRIQDATHAGLESLNKTLRGRRRMPDLYDGDTERPRPPEGP